MEIDISKIIKNIAPDHYILHTRGGKHFWADRCSENFEIDPVYRELDWPYIKNIKMKNILVPGLTNIDVYPRMHLTEIDLNKRFIYMHSLVANCIPSPDPSFVCNHKNGNVFDYRLNNLEWVSNSENSRGVKRPKLNYDELYNKYKTKYVAKR